MQCIYGCLLGPIIISFDAIFVQSIKKMILKGSKQLFHYSSTST